MCYTYVRMGARCCAKECKIMHEFVSQLSALYRFQKKKKKNHCNLPARTLTVNSWPDWTAKSSKQLNSKKTVLLQTISPDGRIFCVVCRPTAAYFLATEEYFLVTKRRVIVGSTRSTEEAEPAAWSYYPSAVPRHKKLIVSSLNSRRPECFLLLRALQP